jgi:hypothetical protein
MEIVIKFLINVVCLPLFVLGIIIIPFAVIYEGMFYIYIGEENENDSVEYIWSYIKYAPNKIYKFFGYDTN